MSINLPTGLLATLYEDGAEAIRTQVNNTTITVYYKSYDYDPITVPFSQEPQSYDFLGGRTQIYDTQGKSDIDASGVKDKIVPENLTVRAYFGGKKLLPSAQQIGVADDANICKIISLTSDRIKLRNAIYIEVDGRKWTNIYEDTPHGLFGKQYTTTYWTVMNE